MSLIEKLTPSQENQLAVYRNKWLAIGLSTDRINRKQKIEDFIVFNSIVLDYKERPVVVFMDSPLTAWIATLLLYNFCYNKCGKESQVRSQVESQVRSQVESQVWSQVGSQVRSQVESQVWSQVGSQVESQVRSQVESQVWSQVGSQVWSQVRSQVGSQVWSQVESQVESQVWSQVWSQVRSQVESQVKDIVWPYLNGNLWAGYFSFYDFCNKVLGIKFQVQDKWDLLLKTSDVSLIYPFKDFIVVSEKPTNIKMKNMMLHNEKGPSVSYADGFCLYALNGVRVSKELVETSAEKLDPQLVAKETNAEIRREIVRKIGIERICHKLGSSLLEKRWGYELITLNLGDRVRPYLKMVNPSTGTYHLEGIEPSIKTVEDALNWRNGIKKYEEPLILT
jgi:hypothetical protein